MSEKDLLAKIEKLISEYQKETGDEVYIDGVNIWYSHNVHHYSFDSENCEFF